MPEAEENKQDLVDIDTSGPGAEIELEEPMVCTNAPSYSEFLRLDRTSSRETASS